MCSPATCRRCGGVTWTGCGSHVDQVLAGVPAERRCRCSADDGAPPPRTGALRRLLRR